MTESTENKTAIPPPDLPPPQPTTPGTQTADKPTGYDSVSGASQSVSAIRHNPINGTEKANEVKVENREESKVKERGEEDEKKVESSSTSNTQQAAQLQQTNEHQQAQQQQAQLMQMQQMQQHQQQLQAQQIQQQQLHQQQQQLLAAQQQMNVNNPAMFGMYGMAADNNKNAVKNSVNKYSSWPPASEQQYVSFHPLGWPIDADYQYQISNYLGPTAAATMAVNPSAASSAAALNNINNMMAMQQANALQLGINPLIAAQAAVQNPLSAASLLAASAAFNPLLSATSSGINGAAAAATNQLLTNATPSINTITPNLAAAAAAATSGAIGAISGKQYSLFVFHLPEDIDDHGLLQLFAPYGAMRSNVMRHDTGRSRGFGFVHFNTRHEAQIAIDMMNGHQIGRKRLRVSFKREEPHDKIRSNIGSLSGSNMNPHGMQSNNQSNQNSMDPNDIKNE